MRISHRAAPLPEVRRLLAAAAALAALLVAASPANALVPAVDAGPIETVQQLVQETAPTHVPLTGSVKITTQGHGFLPIRLLKDVRFGASSAAPHSTIDLEGGGGFAGIALVPDDGSGTALLAGRIDSLLSCASRCLTGSGGVVVRSQGLLRDGTAPSSAHVVPAGTYRLFVLSAAGPATVRLTFPELPTTSAQELVAYTYTGATVALPGNRAPLQDQRSVYYAGQSGNLTGTGLVFTYVEVIGEVSHAGQIYTCAYDGAEPQGGVAYAPQCPGGSFDAADVSLNPNAAPVGYRVTRHAFRANLPAGTYGLGGGFVTGSNSIETTNTVAVWLNY